MNIADPKKAMMTVNRVIDDQRRLDSRNREPQHVKLDDISANVMLRDGKLSKFPNVQLVDIRSITVQLQKHSFARCFDLKVVQLPPCIKELPEGCFHNCKSLDRVVLLQDRAKGYLLERIRGTCFRGCEKLPFFSFPGSLTQIGDEAFCDCKMLGKGMLLDMGLMGAIKKCSIGERAFRDCIGLGEVSAPNKAEFGACCFEGCKNLTRFTFGDGEVVFGGRCFIGCEDFDVLGQIPSSVKAFPPFFFDRTKTAKSAVIDLSRFKSLEVLGEGVFCTEMASKFKTIKFPTDCKITSFGRECFSNCSLLSFPPLAQACPELKEIGINCFSGCRNFKRSLLHGFQFPKKMKCVQSEWDFESGLPDDLTNVDLSQLTDLEGLEERAFFKHAKLVSFALPTGVGQIGDECFAECEALNAADFSGVDKLEVIGNGVFRGCRMLKSFGPPPKFKSALEGKKSGAKRQEATIEIPKEMFMDCIALSRVDLHECVRIEEIGPRAFLNCASLVSFEFPPTVKVIAASAFRGCGELRQVDLSNAKGCQRLLYRCFEGCKSLNDVLLPESVQVIGDRAFAFVPLATFNKRGMQSKAIDLSLLVKLESIGTRAFWGAKEAGSLHLPPNLHSVGSAAFYECRSLRTVVIGPCIFDCGPNAFDGTGDVTTLELTGEFSTEGNPARRKANLESIRHRQARIVNPSIKSKDPADLLAQCRQRTFYRSIAAMLLRNRICSEMKPASAAVWSPDEWKRAEGIINEVLRRKPILRVVNEEIMLEEDEEDFVLQETSQEANADGVGVVVS